MPFEQRARVAEKEHSLFCRRRLPLFSPHPRGLAAALRHATAANGRTPSVTEVRRLPPTGAFKFC